MSPFVDSLALHDLPLRPSIPVICQQHLSLLVNMPLGFILGLESNPRAPVLDVNEGGGPLQVLQVDVLERGSKQALL